MWHLIPHVPRRFGVRLGRLEQLAALAKVVLVGRKVGGLWSGLRRRFESMQLDANHRMQQTRLTWSRPIPSQEQKIFVVRPWALALQHPGQYFLPNPQARIGVALW